MKKLFVLFVCSLAVAAISCQNQNAELGDEMLTKIAKNPYYKAYLAAHRSIQFGIARHDFDMQRISTVIVQNPSTGICDIPKEEFVGIFGGTQYQELSCDFSNKVKDLDNKLPDFSKLTLEQEIKVSKIHDELEGINWKQTIGKAILTRN